MCWDRLHTLIYILDLAMSLGINSHLILDRCPTASEGKGRERQKSTQGQFLFCFVFTTLSCSAVVACLSVFSFLSFILFLVRYIRNIKAESPPSLCLSGSLDPTDLFLVGASFLIVKPIGGRAISFVFASTVDMTS